eukprot:5535805-Lingulodinium_polyedra.AAC.1
MWQSIAGPPSQCQRQLHLFVMTSLRPGRRRLSCQLPRRPTAAATSSHAGPEHPTAGAWRAARRCGTAG